MSGRPILSRSMQIDQPMIRRVSLGRIPTACCLNAMLGLVGERGTSRTTGEPASIRHRRM